MPKYERIAGMTLMLEIAGGLIMAIVGGFVLIFVVCMIVNAFRPEPKYVPPFKFPKEPPINPGNVDRPLR